MRLFLDGASLDSIKRYADDALIQGFTTNPTLMAAEGVTDYESWAKEALSLTDKPISFEVLADDADNISRQAFLLASWGKNVWVKIPITTTNGTSNVGLIHSLSQESVRVNVTAVCTFDQIDAICAEDVTSSAWPMCVSIFAGRIADTGRDPCPFVAYTVDRTRKPDLILSHVLWASTREVLNVHQADKAGADIVTVSEVLFDRYCRSLDYPLQFVSQDTVIQFHQDGQRAGLIL